MMMHPNQGAQMWIDDDNRHQFFATKLLLFCLLFEEQKELCAKVVSQKGLIVTCIKLLGQAAEFVEEYPTSLDKITPNWVSRVMLLIDLHMRTCTSMQRHHAINLQMHKKQWMWFDERTGKWYQYSVQNMKTIEDAYKEGESSVRFTAGRRRYKVDFHQMLQFNEESGNKRPIMTSYTKKPVKKSKKDADSKKINLTDYQLISQEDSSALVRYCVSFIKNPLHSDAIHASMRLLLRLTRFCDEGGVGRAWTFAQLDGVKHILQLKKRHGFQGFESLATLLIRRVFEDKKTVKYAMNKWVRHVVAKGASNRRCGVAANSQGSKEANYMMRVLAPACLHSQDIFKQACIDNISLQLPSDQGRTNAQIQHAEKELLENNATRKLKCDPQPNENTLPPFDYKEMSHPAVETMRMLLNFLVLKKYPKYDPSSEWKKHPYGQHFGPIASMGTPILSVTPKMTHRQQTSSPEDSSNYERMVSKSSILRIIAEIVKSYPVTASIVANHQYQADPNTTIIKQDSSCLSVLLDHLLVPKTNTKKESGDKKSDKSDQKQVCDSDENFDDDFWDDNCPLLCSDVTDVHLLVVNELKGAINRAVGFPESKKKHMKLRALLELTGVIIQVTTVKQVPRIRSRVEQQEMQGNHPHNNQYMPKLMVRRGLAADLAKVIHHIDLGSSEMAETVNAALNPLEILCRWSTLKKPTEDKKQGSGNQNNQQNPSTSTDENASSSSQNATAAPTLMRAGSNDMDTDPVVVAEDNQSQSNDNNDSMLVDHHAVPLEDLVVYHQGNPHDDVSGDADDDDVTDVEDDDEDDDSDETEGEDDDDDNDVLGSDEQMDPVYNYDVINNYNLGDQENNLFVQLEDLFSEQLDAMSRGQGNPNIIPVINSRTRGFPHAYLDMQGFGTSTPQSRNDATPISIVQGTSGGRVTSQHPLLVRPQMLLHSLATNNQPSNQQNVVRGPPENWSQRVLRAGQNIGAMRQNQVNTPNQEVNQEVFIQRAAQPGDPRRNRTNQSVFHRLLEPVAANGMYLGADLVGEMRNLVNQEVQQLPDPIFASMLPDNLYETMLTGGYTENLQTTLSRWIEECCVLESHDVYDCVTLVKEEIFDKVVEKAKKEIAKRAEQRRILKEEKEKKKKELMKKKQEEEEKKRKEREEREAQEAEGEGEGQAEGEDNAAAEGEPSAENPPQAETPPTTGENAQQQNDDVDRDVTDAQPMDTGDSPAELPQQPELPGQPSSTVTQEPQTTTAPSQQQEPSASDAATNQQAASNEPSNQQQANQPQADDGPTVWNNVDPQFLIAVPQDVRAEIIRDTLNRNAESSSGQANVLSTRLNPEFLNALPQNIQQEVIDQQRRHEEQRAAFNQATQPSADNSSFIHQLEPDLRRQLLGEMEDSEIAQLPQALQEEARSLRAENERRQMV